VAPDTLAMLEDGWRQEMDQDAENIPVLRFKYLAISFKSHAMQLPRWLFPWESYGTILSLKNGPSQYSTRYQDFEDLRMFLHITQEVAQRRVVTFGGNPRSVLERAIVPASEKILKDTIESLDIERAMREIGNTKVSLLSMSSLPFYYQPDPLPRYWVLFFSRTFGLGGPMVSTSSRQYFAGLGNKGCSHSQEQPGEGN